MDRLSYFAHKNEVDIFTQAGLKRVDENEVKSIGEKISDKFAILLTLNGLGEKISDKFAKVLFGE